MVINFLDTEFIEIRKLLSKPCKILILTHINPDGDAMGCALAMYNFLKEKHDETVVLVPNSYPEYFEWMPGNEQVLIFSKNNEKGKQVLQNAEIIFCLDFNSPNRIGEVEPHFLASKAKRILIDHHPIPEFETDFSYTDTSVSSASELVFEFMVKLYGENSLNKQVAECLLTGIMSDTGCFNFNSSTPRTYEIVANLLRYGIDKEYIKTKIYDNYSIDRMKLLGFCIGEKMVVLPEFRTAYIFLTMEELTRYNFASGDTEGFVNYPLSIKEVVFTALFMENKEQVKISLRSRGNFDVNLFARTHFEGGGHFNASGARTKLPINEAIQYFLSLLPLYQNQLLNTTK